MTGYGSDVWCEDQIIAGRMAYGWRMVLQACFRRLTTPRGALWFLTDPDSTGDAEGAYGFDIRSWIGQVGAEDAVRSLPALISAELTKDPRVGRARATAELMPRADGNPLEDMLRIRILITLADSSQTFPLTIAASAVSAAIIRGER